MHVTRTFKVTGIVVAASVAVLVVAAALDSDGLQVLGVLGLTFAGPVFAVSAVRHLLRGILWRVGSRLLVSYLLIGVVPIPFIVGLIYLGFFLMSGQLAARRARAAIAVREAVLESAANEAVDDVARGREEPSAAFTRIASEHEMPALGWVFVPASGGAASGEGPIPAASVLSRTPAAAGEDTPFVLTADGTKALARAGSGPRGTVLVYLPLDTELARVLESETGIPIAFTNARVKQDGDVDRNAIRIGKGKDTDLEIDERVDLGSKVPSGEAEAKGPIRGRWVAWFVPLDIPIVDAKTGDRAGKERAIFLLRTSVAREFRELFSGAKLNTDDGGMEVGNLVVKIMKLLGVTTLGIYFTAALIAAILVFRIARATRRLSIGIAEVEKGNFEHRIRLSGRDQLSGLVDGFNRMTAHLGESVAARAEQEALRHELDVARELQTRLLPPASFRFPGVEIATDFRPAAQVGGDFYHFAAEPGGALVVAIGDVSGHGLPTGIVMASAKSLLSALSATGMAAEPLFATLDREIRETTESRTFVTLAHARFRFADRVVELTNAGHVYPLRVDASGRATSIPNPSRPLGLTLPGTFRTVTSEVAPGDLWLFYSDGIVEALSPSEEEFGFERLEAIATRMAGRRAAELRDEVLSSWRAFTGRDEPLDDRTLIVLEITAS